jgi:hypothetical protein
MRADPSTLPTDAVAKEVNTSKKKKRPSQDSAVQPNPLVIMRIEPGGGDLMRSTNIPGVYIYTIRTYSVYGMRFFRLN